MEISCRMAIFENLNVACLYHLDIPCRPQEVSLITYFFGYISLFIASTSVALSNSR